MQKKGLKINNQDDGGRDLLASHKHPTGRRPVL